ncbi:MAG: heme ABC exporter ATP-binding protein CcmA [Persicimonas sp.]
MTTLSAENITHRFGDTAVLEEVTFEVDAGESIVIVGPNGVGKTTLLRILAGLLEPTDGVVRVDKTPLEDIGRRQLARKVSVVAQARPRVFEFSALEVVLMGFHARTGRFSLPSEAQKERALEAMDRLEIADLADRPASVLSGGELQRVLMARTMVTDADLWLLDEPTASLDLRHQVALLDRVREHCEAGGTAIAVLHDLALAHRYFERALVLDEGRLIADGPADEKLTDELLSRVFDVSLVGGRVGERKVWVVE